MPDSVASDLHTGFSGGKVVRYSHLLKNVPQFVVIHTVKDFSVLNEAEIDVFLEFPCLLYDPTGAGNLMCGSSALYKPSSREKAESAAIGRTGDLRPGRPSTWETTVCPWRWKCPLLWAYRPAACTPCPLGGVCRDSTPSVIWWLVVLGGNRRQQPGLYQSLVFSSSI